MSSSGMNGKFQPEFDHMRTLELFTNEEILKIKKTRENFEYKIDQQSRVIKDYVEYIKYERNLMGVIKEKLKNSKIAAHPILTLIAENMRQIYSQALTNFPKNLRFWEEYIKFQQNFKYTKSVSATFERMLQHHGDNADVWVRAILWAHNENNDEETRKNLLLRAQLRHPECAKLYFTLFQIELENKSRSDEHTAMLHADIVYNSSKKKFSKIDFFVEMLNIADKFSYAYSIQENILRDMREMFPTDEILWHTLAQRELSGAHIDCSVDFAGLIKMEDGEIKNEDSKLSLKKLKIEDLTSYTQNTLRKRIQLYIEIYNEAVKILNTSKMWNYYINAMLEINSDLSTQAALKRYALKQAFEGASESNHLSEDQYIQYIELLFSTNRKDKNIEKVFQTATNVYRDSMKLWHLFMRYYIQEKSVEKVQEVFKTANRQFGAKSVEFWLTYFIFIRSIRSVPARAEFERYLYELSRKQTETFNNLKATIVEYAATTAPIQKARKIYNSFVSRYPVSYEVHDMMAQLESKLMVRDPDVERGVLENLITHFGENRTDVWLRYMQFERHTGEPKNVSRLHRSALSTLKPELLDDYNALYNLFSNGVV